MPPAPPWKGDGNGDGGGLTFQAHSCHKPALRSEIFGINYSTSPGLRSLSPASQAQRSGGWGLLGGGRDWGENERNLTLTPTQQTSDKLLCGHSLPAHLVCISLRLPPSPRQLSLLCLSPTPTPLSCTSPGPHPAGPGTQQKPAMVPVWNNTVPGAKGVALPVSLLVSVLFQNTKVKVQPPPAPRQGAPF